MELYGTTFLKEMRENVVIKAEMGLYDTTYLKDMRKNVAFGVEGVRKAAVK